MTDWKIGIAVAQFNDIVTSRLLLGAKSTLNKKHISEENIFVMEVPGAFELPLASQFLIDQNKVHGVVAIGCVLRGATSHYDYVCSGATSGLMTVQLSRSIPVGFCLLTCDTMEQALDRAGGKYGNLGAAYTESLLEMIRCKGHK